MELITDLAQQFSVTVKKKSKTMSVRPLKISKTIVVFVLFYFFIFEIVYMLGYMNACNWNKQ